MAETAKIVQQPGMVIDLNSCTACKACQVACTNANQTPYWSGNFRTVIEDILEGSARDFLPRICQQCQDAPCESVCPTGATYRGDDGIVHIDYEACIGCKACVAACPYGARYQYSRADVKTNKAIWGEMSKHPVPHVDKCDLCSERRADGKEPACVATCMGKARIYGDLADPNSAVSQAAKKAVALGADYGTKPRILYIPKANR